MKSGIYTITAPDGGMYVGSAVSFRHRWWKHLSTLRLGTHHCRRLQGAFDQYGEDNITFSKIIVCARENLLLYEQVAIDGLQPSYNTLRFAGSCLGSKRSPETCAKIAASKIGKPRPAYAIEALRRALTGRKRTPEAIAKSAAGSKGLKRTPETREKISKARLGKPRLPETVEKMRIASTGRKAKPEVAEMLRTMHIGVKKSAETKKKISESASAFCRENAELVAARVRAIHLGAKRGPEARARMSAGIQAAKAMKKTG